jgi:hypothetical protein
MALLFILPMVLLHALPFAVTAAMPSWRWLVPTTFTVIAGCAYLLHDVEKHGDGIGADLTAAMLELFIVGAASGFIGRAIVLLARAQGKDPDVRAILFASFLVSPLLLGLVAVS